MPYNLFRPSSPAALIDDQRDVLLPATCPMCHTNASLSQSAIDAGSNWRCVRCGQLWDAERLAVVATYSARVADHDCVGRPILEGGHDAVTSDRDLPADGVDGSRGVRDG